MGTTWPGFSMVWLKFWLAWEWTCGSSYRPMRKTAGFQLGLVAEVTLLIKVCVCACVCEM